MQYSPSLNKAKSREKILRNEYGVKGTLAEQQRAINITLMKEPDTATATATATNVKPLPSSNKKCSKCSHSALSKSFLL